jgi:hypothetical protein
MVVVVLDVVAVVVEVAARAVVVEGKHVRVGADRTS